MKTNKELLAEIDGLEAELRVITADRDRLNDMLAKSVGEHINKNTEIQWLKRIVINLSEPRK